METVYVVPDEKKFKIRIAEVEALTCTMNKQESSRKEVKSSSGNYDLVIYNYTTGEGTWDYTKAKIIDNKEGDVIGSVSRNYSHFWYAFVENHFKTGHDYLLCGEDYQGYTVIDLTAKKKISFLPDSAENGAGFCWVEVTPSPDGKYIAVKGCYWAFPEELRVYDFSTPEEPPFKVLHKDDDPRIELDKDPKDAWDGSCLYFDRVIEDDIDMEKVIEDADNKIE